MNNDDLLEKIKNDIVKAYDRIPLIDVLNGGSTFCIKKEFLGSLTIEIDTSIHEYARIDGTIIKLKSDLYTQQQKILLVSHEIMHFIFTFSIDYKTDLFLDRSGMKEINNDVVARIYDAFIDRQLIIIYPDLIDVFKDFKKSTLKYTELKEVWPLLKSFISEKEIDKKIVDISPLICDFIYKNKRILIEKFGIAIPS